MTGRTLALLGVLFVFAYTVYVLWPERPQGVTTAIFVILVATWVIFVVDVVIRIALTPHGRRWHYAWHHPLEVLSAILPVFRALRVVGLLQDLPVLKRHTPSAVRAQFIILALAYACAWVFFLALATLDAERDTKGANITTFGDAIWWAIVTITTVGYGDLYPVTPAGRFYAVLLMAGGIAIVGTASATIISYLNERVAGLRHTATRSRRRRSRTGEQPDPAATHALPPERRAQTSGRRPRATRRRRRVACRMTFDANDAATGVDGIRREILTWDEFGDAARALAGDVLRSGFPPDVVIAIARGGLLLAGAISYALGTKACGSINVEFYSGHRRAPARAGAAPADARRAGARRQAGTARRRRLRLGAHARQGRRDHPRRGRRGAHRDALHEVAHRARARLRLPPHRRLDRLPVVGAAAGRAAEGAA